MAKMIEFTSDEVDALLDLAHREYSDADNDEDSEFWSDIHVKLGGDKLFEPESEDEEKDE